MGMFEKEPIMEEEKLPDTLTPKDGGASSQQDGHLTKMPWGRLIACKTYLPSLDLVGTFTFGRSEQCTMVITTESCPGNSVLNISKVHFRIENNDDDDLVYITDLSKNGTFLNHQKLGTGNRRILQNDDVISLAMPRYSVYVFRSLKVVEDFLPAVLIPKYANIRSLGRGSSGEVRLVKDRDTFNQYAIKKIILDENNLSQKDKINHPTKIKNEIEILRSLVHPGIISCQDIVKCDREIYLVLEYMAGGELTRRVINEPMTEDCVKFYFLQLLYAVQYLHSNGVIHRDLKPENVLLMDNRQETVLKITDFGLSKITNASDMRTQCGTMRYMAPEVLNNAFREYGEYGKKVDVWSLGVMLFFMFSRTYPFSGENNVVLARNILKCSYSMTGDTWSDVSPELKHLIHKILVVYPKRRLSIYDIVNHPWIKNDYGVKFRVENMLQQEGLENPLQDLVLEPPEKKFKFSNNSYSSSGSSGELNSTVMCADSNVSTVSTDSSYSSGNSTMCY